MGRRRGLQPHSAASSRQRNDTDVPALGASVVGGRLATPIPDARLYADFEGGRHANRIALITDLKGLAAGATPADPSGAPS